MFKRYIASVRPPPAISATAESSGRETCRRPSCRSASVDDDILANDVGRIRRREPERSRRNLGGRGNSLGRIGSRHTNIARRPVLARPNRHRRIHRSRAQAIDANAILNSFERRSPCQTADGRLGGGIGSQRRTHKACSKARADIDDDATTRRLHGANLVLHRQP